LLLTLSRAKEQADAHKKKLEFELPYFMTFITLLATSGFGPSAVFQKLKDVSLLPASQKEANKILKRVELLGLDPLTAMTKVKEMSPSKEFAEFLGGYVSSIQGGGDVVSYLQSKMTSAFEKYAEIQRQSVEKVKTVIEAYMTIQVVVLAVYIIINSMENPTQRTESEFTMSTLFVIVPPLISIFFLLIAVSMHISKLKELPIKKILIFGMPGFVGALAFIYIDIMPSFDAYVLAAALIIASIWPVITFKKKYRELMDAESATPSILRDIAETRKAGIGPEKCVIQACKRKDFGVFNVHANSIAIKIERGSSLIDIYNSLKKKVESFHVLISFKILFEIISSGGGNVDTIESLALTAEKIHNVDAEKQELLKPYVLVGFLLIGLTSFTTLMVIDSLSGVSILTEFDEQRLLEITEKRENSIATFSMSVLIQAWLAGLFLGKITTGSYSGGFQYAAILSVIAMIGVTIIQAQLFNLTDLLFNVEVNLGMFFGDSYI